MRGEGREGGWGINFAILISRFLPLCFKCSSIQCVLKIYISNKRSPDVVRVA